MSNDRILLPPEIFYEISLDLSQKDLASLALVSRRLAQIMQVRLFTNVILEPEWRNVELFASSLRANTRMMSLVETLRIHIKITNGKHFDYRQLELPSSKQQQDLCFILCSLSPTLRQLHFGPDIRWEGRAEPITRFQGEEFLDSLFTAKPCNLDTVIFERVHFPKGMDILKALRWRSVHFLHVAGGPFEWRTEEAQLGEAIAKVEDLTLCYNCGHFNNALEQVLSVPELSMAINLKTLSLWGQPKPTMLARLLPASQASLVALSWSNIHIDTIFADLAALNFHLPFFRSLKIFRLQGIDMGLVNDGLDGADWLRSILVHDPLANGTSPSPLKTAEIAVHYDCQANTNDRMRERSLKIGQILEQAFASHYYPDIESVSLTFHHSHSENSGLSSDVEAEISSLAEMAAPTLHKAGKLKVVAESLLRPRKLDHIAELASTLRW